MRNGVLNIFSSKNFFEKSNIFGENMEKSLAQEGRQKSDISERKSKG